MPKPAQGETKSSSFLNKKMANKKLNKETARVKTPRRVLGKTKQRMPAAKGIPMNNNKILGSIYLTNPLIIVSIIWLGYLIKIPPLKERAAKITTQVIMVKEPSLAEFFRSPKKTMLNARKR